jgi:hypothetical protein
MNEVTASASYKARTTLKTSQWGGQAHNKGLSGCVMARLPLEVFRRGIKHDREQIQLQTNLMMEEFKAYNAKHKFLSSLWKWRCLHRIVNDGGSKREGVSKLGHMAS